MARVHGKNADYSLNAVALEGELRQVTQTAEVPAADVTAFADAWQVALAGKKNVRDEVEGAYNPASGGGDATIFPLIGGGPVSTVFAPGGGTVGANNPHYKCTASGLTGALVASYRVSLPVGEAAKYSATVQHSGSTTRATS